MNTVETIIEIDEETLNQFEEFCSLVGLNVSVAFNIFARAVLREKRIPFEIAVENKLSLEREEAVKNFHEMRAEAEKRGFLSDEEIEFEIREARREIKERELKEKGIAI